MRKIIFKKTSETYEDFNLFQQIMRNSISLRFLPVQIKRIYLQGFFVQFLDLVPSSLLSIAPGRDLEAFYASTKFFR